MKCARHALRLEEIAVWLCKVRRESKWTYGVKKQTSASAYRWLIAKLSIVEAWLPEQTSKLP